MADDTIELTLVAEPRQLSMSGRAVFRIGFVARNRGIATIDPQLTGLQLIIDGRNSLHWADAIGNGHRDTEWFALPAGRETAMRWAALGEYLFPAPGDYCLSLRLGARTTPPVLVQVAP